MAFALETETDCGLLFFVFLKHRSKQGGKKLQIPFAAPDAFLGVLKGWSVTTALEIVIKALYVSECAGTRVWSGLILRLYEHQP